MRQAYIQLTDEQDSQDIQALRIHYAELISHEGDAGLDLFCINKQKIDNYAGKIKLGFSMVIVDTAIEGGVETKTPIAFMLLARSSTYKTGIIQANCVGIVDAGYRGELMVPVVTTKLVTVDAFSRIFQAVPFDGKGVDTIQVLEEMHDLQEMFPSDRGVGGFGSTGGHAHAGNRT